jgi:DNA polymerase-3 subunit alpha
LFDLGGEIDQLLQDVAIRLPNITEFQKQVILDKEREAIGIYISGHPLDDYQAILGAMPCSVLELQEADGSGALKDNERIKTGGMLRSCERKPTRSGSGIMGYGEIEGITGVVELVLFPRVLQDVGSAFFPNQKVMISGKLNLKENQANSILVDKLIPLEQVGLMLYLRYMSLTKEQYDETMALLAQYPGNIPVALYDKSSNKINMRNEQQGVNLSDALIQKLHASLGKENVKVSVK